MNSDDIISGVALGFIHLVRELDLAPHQFQSLIQDGIAEGVAMLLSDQTNTPLQNFEGGVAQATESWLNRSDS